MLGVVLLWLAIYAFKMSRLEREIAELAELAARRRAEDEAEGSSVREETPVR